MSITRGLPGTTALAFVADAWGGAASTPNIVSCWPVDVAALVVEVDVARLATSRISGRFSSSSSSSPLVVPEVVLIERGLVRLGAFRGTLEGAAGELAFEVLDDRPEPRIAADKDVEQVLRFGEVVVVAQAAPELLDDGFAAEHGIELEQDADRRRVEAFAGLLHLDEDVVPPFVEVSHPALVLGVAHVVAVDDGAAKRGVQPREQARKVVGVPGGRGEDEALVLAGRGAELRQQRQGELANEWLHVVLVPAQLLADAALVEIRQLGHLGGSELVDSAVGRLELDGVVLHLQVEVLEDSALLPRLPHRHHEQRIDDETVLARDVARAGDRVAIESNGRCREEQHRARRQGGERLCPGSALAEMMSLVAHDVHVAGLAELLVDVRCGGDLLIGGNDEVDPWSRACGRERRFRPGVLPTRPSTAQHLQSARDAAVDLRA